MKTVGPGTPRIHCCHLGQAHSLNIVPPLPSLLCACLVATDHPPDVGFSLSVGCCCSYRVVTVDHSGFLPVGHGGAGGLDPVGGVVLLMGFAFVTTGPVVLGGLCPCYQ